VTDWPPTGASPWRLRDFRIAWSAGFVNNTGDWVLTIALPVFVFVETESGAATALLFVSQLIAGAVLGPIGGGLVDRLNLKRCLILTNLAQAVAVLPLLAVNADRIWPAYVVMAAQSALTQLNNPANVALLPRVVTSEQLAPANAALAGAESLARLVGSLLGGVLVAWGGLGPVVVVDAISFMLVAVGLGFLAADTDPMPAPVDSGGGVREGFRIVRLHPPLASVLSLQAVAHVAQGAFVVLFVVFVVDILNDDGTGLGIIRASMALGALVGASIIARIAERTHPTMLFAAGLAGMGAVSLVFWNAPAVTAALWVYVLLFSLSGIPGTALSVGLFTTIQTSSPQHAIGKVTGVMGAGEAIGVGAGAILAGLLIDRVSLGILLNGQAAIYLITGALAFRLAASNRATRTET